MSDPSLAERKKGASGCAMSIVGLVTVVFLVGSLFLVWAMRCDRQLASQLQEIRDRGEPTSAAELEEYYCLPKDVVDTTALWLAGSEGLTDSDFWKEVELLPLVGKSRNSVGKSRNSVPAVGESWEQLEEVELLLEKYRDHIELRHSAAEQGGAARYPTDYESTFSMFKSHVGRLRSGNDLLELNARVHAHRGRPAEVARCLMTMLRFGESFKYEPQLLPHSLRLSFDGQSVEATAEALADVAFTDEQLAALQNSFRDVDLAEGTRRAIVGYRCFAIEFLNDPANGEGFTTATMPKHLWAKVVKQDTATCFEMTAEAMGICDDSFADAVATLDAQEQRVKELTGPRHDLTRTVTDIYAICIKLKARGDAQIRMADLGLAIARYRLANDKLPDSPIDCVPEFIDSLPRDPFTDGDIRYETSDVNGGSFVLYCLGENQLDDGGVEDDYADIMFRVEGHGAGTPAK